MCFEVFMLVKIQVKFFCVVTLVSQPRRTWLEYVTSSVEINFS